MNNLRLTKEFRMEIAHALDNHDGKCRNIHGHSYRLSVTVFGKPIETIGSAKEGMIMDFSDLKHLVKDNIVDVFDHALVLQQDSPFVNTVKERQEKLVLFEKQPSCENMLLNFITRLGNLLPEGVELKHMRLSETANSYAEWYKEDQ